MSASCPAGDSAGGTPTEAVAAVVATPDDWQRKQQQQVVLASGPTHVAAGQNCVLHHRGVAAESCASLLPTERQYLLP